MSSPTLRDRLQPSLFDRLDDDLGSALALLVEARRELDRHLDDGQRAALTALLSEDRLVTRPPTPQELQPFAALDEDGMAVLQRVVDLERSRQLELRRHFVISVDRLRESVLRDLQNLFNTTSQEHEPARERDVVVPAFDGLPQAQASVVNYGIPPIAGRIRTPFDFIDLGTAIEQAIIRFEPRVRNVKVRVESDDGGLVAAIKSPVAYVIEGEVWGYPFAEPLRVRTVLDLDSTRLEIDASRPTTPQ